MGKKFSFSVAILIAYISRGSLGNDTTTDPSGSKMFDNNWSFAVVGGLFAIVVILWFLSRVINSYRRSKLKVVYDGCGPGDYKVKYQVRVKTSPTLELSSGRNPKQSGSLAMDLCKPNGNFIARIKVPEEKMKDSKIKSKNNSKVYKFCFASSKSDHDINIGFIRLDYSKFGEKVFVNYVEIKGLENSSSIFRCFVNSKIGLLKPAREELIATTQTFPCKKNEGVTDRSDPMEYDLTPLEYVLFFMVASSIHCICVRFFIHDAAVTNHNNYPEMSTSGAATGFLSLFITFLVIVVYRIALKKNLGSKPVNGVRVVLLILLVLISFSFYVTAGIYGSDLTNFQLRLWACAIGVGVGIILIIGLPLIIGFQFCCRCVSPEPDFEENETITKTYKSSIRPESGTPAVTKPYPPTPHNLPKKKVIPIKIKNNP